MEKYGQAIGGIKSQMKLMRDRLASQEADQKLMDEEFAKLCGRIERLEEVQNRVAEEILGIHNRDKKRDTRITILWWSLWIFYATIFSIYLARLHA